MEEAEMKIKRIGESPIASHVGNTMAVLCRGKAHGIAVVLPHLMPLKVRA